VNPLPLTLEVFKRLATSGNSGDTNCELHLCRVKTDISAMLTVKSSLDPHMIIELKDETNHGPYVMVMVMLLLHLFCFF
jgi:hypothetical protein